jgi:hypothetical protein
MSRQKFDNQSLPGGELGKQYKKGPKTPMVPGPRLTRPEFIRPPKPKLGKEPAAPKPRKR